MSNFLLASALSSFGVVLVAYTATATINGKPDFCNWVSRVEVKTPVDPSACRVKCAEFCTANPGRYFCSGFTGHTDTDEKRINATDTKKYLEYVLHTQGQFKQGAILATTGASAPGLGRRAGPVGGAGATRPRTAAPTSTRRCPAWRRTTSSTGTTRT